MNLEVDLFVPCFVDQLYPQSALNAVKLLEKAGCKVNYNASQTCCGQPSFNAGHWDQAREVATKFLEEYHESRFLVILSSSCTGMVRNYYNELFANSSLHLQQKHVSKVAYELVEFLTKVVKFEDFGAKMPGVKAAYHDACAALREVHLQEEPRRLLSLVEGLEIVPIAGQTTCCGFGGTFAVKYESISNAMAEQKTEAVTEAGVEVLISSDLSCLLHLQGFLKAESSPIKTMYIADVLVQGWVEEQAPNL